MASPTTKLRTHIENRSGRGVPRLWLTCLLCLCAWRGPMPIVHSHSLELQVLATNLQLATHAASHHLRDIDHGSSGWHLHFILPASGSDDVPPDDDDAAAPSLAWPTPLLEAEAQAASFDSPPSLACVADLIGPALVQWRTSDALALSAAPPPPRPKRISPHAWLCIARC